MYRSSYFFMYGSSYALTPFSMALNAMTGGNPRETFSSRVGYEAILNACLQANPDLATV